MDDPAQHITAQTQYEQIIEKKSNDDETMRRQLLPPVTIPTYRVIEVDHISVVTQTFTNSRKHSRADVFALPSSHVPHTLLSSVIMHVLHHGTVDRAIDREQIS